MAVPQRHIRGILDIIVKYVDKQDVGVMLDDLSQTDAYGGNKSFRDTIDRLRETWWRTV